MMPRSDFGSPGELAGLTSTPAGTRRRLIRDQTTVIAGMVLVAIGPGVSIVGRRLWGAAEKRAGAAGARHLHG
jgi:hypothetical protein